MSEEDKEEQEEKKKEKQALDDLGVDSTFNLLSDSKDKKKDPEEKKEFRGFK